ncbi:MAG TPA: type II toxin-antitoxin system VapC family toxin [Pseudonocardiaceae bacterium]|nr:type II toxin-antitoxin system VapC family toxin [Pseudonocardiaceae bacterium]
MTVALADTSLFIAIEQGRALRAAPPPRYHVSVVTLGELRLGVLSAPDPETSATRLRTLIAALEADPLVVDEAVADAWAALRAQQRERGRRLPLNDSWIAATAIAHGLPVATQDDDYDDVPGLEVIKL